MMKMIKGGSNMDQQERSIGGLVHLCIILPLWGPIIALFVWLNNRDKSKFVAFHSLQSVFYQLTVYCVLAIGGVFHLILKFLQWIKFPLGDMFVSINGNLLLAIVFFALLYAIFGCFSVISGNEFNYFFIGRKLKGPRTGRDGSFFDKDEDSD